MKTSRAAFAAALLLAATFAPRALRAQADVIRGKVTGADGQPVADARITATSIPGSVVKQGKTDKKGAYQIIYADGEGDYIIGIAAIGHAYKQFEVKRTADQEVLLGDAKLQPVLLDVVTSSAFAPPQKVDRNSITPDVGGTEKPISMSGLPPDQQGDIAAMAASVPGVQLLPGVDGAANGFSVLGLGADQNNVMLNGMQFDGSNLPRDAQISSSLVTSSYDVGKGGFSGAQMNVSTGTSGNYQRRGLNMTFYSPGLTWTDRSAQALGGEATNVSIGGIVAGPVKLNTSTYSAAYQLTRRSNDLQTLLNTNALGLGTAGVSTDSVGRLINLLQGAGIAATAGGIGGTKTSDNGSLLGTYNYNSPTSTSGMAWSGTLNSSWSKNSPASSSVLSTPASSGDRTSYSLGLQGKQSDYLGVVLSETSAGFTVSRNYGTPYLQLPSGRVLVSSTLDGTDGSVQNLSFGGNQSLGASSTTSSATVSNLLRWFSGNNKHTIKLNTDLRYDHNLQDPSNNLLGTFTFNSLADLASGTAASYTRQLTDYSITTGGLTGDVALGDSWRKSPDLQIQYGLRLDGSRFDHAPTFNPAVLSTFGVRNDAVPDKLYFSPRIGFSWTVGTAPQVAAFDGAVRGPRAIISGGVGVFQNASNSSLITTAIQQTGLPSGVQQLYCVGTAAPHPDWAAYDQNPNSVPSQCLDGSAGTVFSSTAPNVTLVDPHFAAQRRVSSNLQWSGRVLDNRFQATLGGTYALNLDQQRTVDLNFLPTERFTLDDEDGRPVFVQPASIVTTTGLIAVGDARVSPAFNRVTMIKSDTRAMSQQVTLSLSPVYTTTPHFTYSGSYTYLHGREQLSGFSSTVGNPLDLTWAPSTLGTHQINYNLGYNFNGYVNVQWGGSFTSGRPFTPTVAGDINGDGVSGNDRAFVFDPKTTTDPALAAAMQQLITNSTGRTRDCLLRQEGQLAGRNSCGTPWSTSGSIAINLDPVKFRMPHRTLVSFSLSNPFGAADLAINGSKGLKGWGQGVSPDQSLLYVRGFDPATKQYQYDVNQRFGATRPSLITLVNPVVLTVQMKLDVGAVRERQMMGQRLDIGRSQPGVPASEGLLKSYLASGAIPNPFLTIIAKQDSLHLTVEQSDSIAAMSRRFTYHVDSIWTPAFRNLAGLPAAYDGDEAFAVYSRARHAALTMLETLAPTVKSLLTADQRRKLPASVNSALDPLYLFSIRNGTYTYLAGGFSPLAAPSGGASLVSFVLAK